MAKKILRFLLVYADATSCHTATAATSVDLFPPRVRGCYVLGEPGAKSLGVSSTGTWMLPPDAPRLRSSLGFLHGYVDATVGSRIIPH